MTAEPIAVALKALADRWDTPGFDPAAHATAPTTVDGMSPAVGPSVRVTALHSIGRLADSTPVLARVSGAKPVTVFARMYFFHNLPGRAHGVALVVVPPGTLPGASGSTADSYYRPTRIAIGRKTAATSPQQRIISVTVPAGLSPGTYLICDVILSDLLPGQQPGVQGPFTMSGAVGAVIVTG